MWGVALIFIAVASCNAELYEVITADLPAMVVGNRIIGGSPTTIEKYPFVVQVYFKKECLCGGSLVTRLHVLSAAHCFVDKKNGNAFPKRYISIRAGTAIMNSGGSVHLVKEIIIHELYNFTRTNNDVAVVVMATPVDYKTSAARKIPIASQDALIPDASHVIAVGWGWTKAANPSESKVLNEVALRIMDLDTCWALFNKRLTKRKYYPITNSTICAGDRGGKKGVCRGDSGGPLLYGGIVVGITSWGVKCSHPKYPSVFVMVAKFTNWIADTVRESRQLKTAEAESTEPYKNGSLSNKVGAITLLTPLLYLILSV